MNTPLRPKNVGLAFGGLLAIWHATWSILVALGWAQFLIDWIFRFHFIQPVYKIMPFDAFFALCLIVITGVFGYILGWVFAIIWNAVQKKA